MFHKKIQSSQKPIAWVLFFVFYLQLISPVLANRLTAKYVADNFAMRYISSEKIKDIFEGVQIENYRAALPEARIPEQPLKKPTALKPSHTKTSFSVGPTQPEMQSFQSVNNANMVDLFSGDFSYNIPLLDVGGYPVNIHYGSGITMDQEASWVGLGWNINPGTINRNMRGLPDDFNGTDKITKTISMKENKTVGVTLGADAELLGKTVSLPNGSSGKATSLGISLGVFHNTYNGWGTETGINAGINSGSGAKGHLSGGIGLTNNSQSGLDVPVSFSYRLGKEDSKSKGFIGIGTNYNSRVGVQSLQMTMQVKQQVNDGKSQRSSNFSSPPGVISFATPSFTPGISIPFSSKQFTFTVKIGAEAWAFHPNFFISGNYSSQYIDPKDQTDSVSAYGYLYYQEAGDQQKVLLDFNREKEVSFRKNTPNIGIPGYTYDIYSISGEGTGGMFRPYRGDIGMIYDHSMATKSSSGRVSLDLGFGGIFHGGVDLNKVWASTKNNPWLNDNVMARYVGFKKSDSLYENVYFKNPGEKVTVDQSFYDKIGDDKLVRVQLSPLTKQNSPIVSATRNLTLFSNAKSVGTLALAANTYKTQRDKRTQVISYLTANEASIKGIGLDTDTKSYSINSFPSTRCSNNYKIIKRIDDIRRPHHLSEISVLNTEGRRYVYGVPAYNIEQDDVAFSVDKSGGNTSTGLVNYTDNQENSIKNDKGKERYFSKEKIPAYAQSFLLSGILSPDYVDITGDGITEDDNGNAVKFNYTQVYGNQNPYHWRSPFDKSKALYNEGLKTYSRDDRGSYSYGKKEVWYMNSIESKTMIATFVLETDTIRKDSYGVTDENGGMATSQKLYRLKQINLYTKADFLKNGAANAKPIKSVHFEYTYELCPGVPSSTNAGKLTLRKIWFSYNKNYKGNKNPYIFNYSSTNPFFSTQSYDRWGNYKSPADNPGTAGSKLTNAEYPYSLQKSNNAWDSSKAAANVEAWTLKEIKLPSGGLMKVSYESDDYAYVQNKRAMQLFSIAGLGTDAASTLSGSLYLPNNSGNDYVYVFVRLTDAVSSKAEIKERYLEGVDKLYFKLFVKMPDNNDGERWGTGYEQIPCFADIEDYDIKSGYANKMIWIRLSKLKGNSPLATSAIQYLRLNLPGKAYPYSEPGDDASIQDVLGMIGSVGANLTNAVKGFEDAARDRNWCNIIDTTKSFVRLNNPDFKKFGGGLRVKKVEVFDNWTTMTSQTESSYGQTYSYTTTALVNGSDIPVSSGVASYEPALGKEENPFFQPIEYAEKMALLGPTDYVYTEEPLGESFFPSAGIGYSKVTVQTINKTKKSANGIDVTEFYTAKEFPTIFESTPLDNESKKPYSNPIGNFLKFDAKRYITLSQGFKVELNDMHGKMKKQSSFAQTDLVHPMSYTSNYYKLDNDNALVKHLSSKVISADSASGVLNMNSQMGKDIDMLIDIREQTSKTISASLQLNVDYAGLFVVLPSKPNLPSFETNRYRSIAVTKVVNRYAILDSVVHFDKGSKISTANAVYDGETGDVLLSRTQNEFDDPVYSFNYPGYWAYSGMEGAYKNIGGTFTDVSFLNGKMNYKGQTENEIKKYFESGDEILFYGMMRKGRGSEQCKTEDYDDLSKYSYVTAKIWAIDVAKSGLGSTGIFFVDKDGAAVTGRATSIKIIRSGKRNLQSKSVGAITSLKNPVKLVNGVNRFVFDSTIDVIASNTVRYTDFWEVDSSSYRKDTMITALTLADSVCTGKNYYAQENYGIQRIRKSGNIFSKPTNFNALGGRDYFETVIFRGGCDGTNSIDDKKTWMRFDFSDIPANSVIKSAYLNLQPPGSDNPQLFERIPTNASQITRIKGYWINDYLNVVGFYNIKKQKHKNNVLFDLYSNQRNGENSTNGAIPISATAFNQKSYVANNPYNASAIVQDMINTYYSSGKKYRPSVVIDMLNTDPCQIDEVKKNVMSFAFNGGTCGQITDKYGNWSKSYAAKSSLDCRPYISICYVKPCSAGSTPVYLTSPAPGYYCTQPKDSFICKPNINDSATNPYRWGIWGNWQPDRPYSYFTNRKDSIVSTSSITNIRKGGVINSFKPYWSFTTAKLSAVEDPTRWVWTTQFDLINSKGLELQNHDQINRYNSAQYGYNQTLPVAVAQNSRSREMVFDGFEDYGYSTDTCSSCPKQRFLNLVAGGTLVDSLSHSGMYSLRVAGNQTDSVSIPVVLNDSLFASIRAKASTTVVNDTVVKGGGNGLNAAYRKNGSISTCYTGAVDNINIAFGDKVRPGSSSCPKKYYTCQWTGYIQPKYSELYSFYSTTDDKLIVYINGDRITRGTEAETNISNGLKLKPIPLFAGQLYAISVTMENGVGPSKAVLEWSSASQRREIVPKSQFYTVSNPAGLDTTVVPVNSRNCTKLDTLKQRYVTLPGFSPIKSTLILVGAWVKEKNNLPDTVSTYRNTQLQVAFNNGTTVTLKPSGKIIEGWQRIEDTLTIPANATQMKIRLMSTNSSVPVYFDDVRIHPFSSNLKSYVYDPVSLRLMAELDENNYASFYEYDDDGTLIRVKKETEKGIKTVKETRSALLK